MRRSRSRAEKHLARDDTARSNSWQSLELACSVCHPVVPSCCRGEGPRAVSLRPASQWPRWNQCSGGMERETKPSVSPHTSPPPKSARGRTWRRPAGTTVGKCSLPRAGAAGRVGAVGSRQPPVLVYGLCCPFPPSSACGHLGSRDPLRPFTLPVCVRSAYSRSRLQELGSASSDGGQDVLGWLRLKTEGAAPRRAPALPPASPPVKRGAFNFGQIGKRSLMFASEFVRRIQLFLLILL